MPKGVYKKSAEHIQKLLPNLKKYMGRQGIESPSYGTHHSKEMKTRLAVIAKTIVIRHHINLKHSDDTPTNLIRCSGRLHSLVHKRAYQYLVETAQIQQYIKWFESQQFKQEGEIWDR